MDIKTPSLTESFFHMSSRLTWEAAELEMERRHKRRVDICHNELLINIAEENKAVLTGRRNFMKMPTNRRVAIAYDFLRKEYGWEVVNEAIALLDSTFQAELVREHKGSSFKRLYVTLPDSKV
jgi:hypothetical protein